MLRRIYKSNKHGLSLTNGLQRGKRGFSLIELIVTIAIIGILVMLASPRFLGRTKEATLAKHLYNVKTLEDTMDRYVLENDRFPRLSEEAYTSEEVEEYANRIRDLTGEEITLDPEGKYYDIDYVTLRDYVKVPDKRDKPNYILQNPVGKVFFLEELTEIASDRADFTASNPIIKNDDSNDDEGKGLPIEDLDSYIYTNGYIPVSTAEDLIAINKNEPHVFGKGTKWQKEYYGGLKNKYIQVENINLSNVDNFKPIGYEANSGFEGVYNGGNFAIKNLKVVRPNEDNIGLFSTGHEANIENIRLISARIEGRSSVGGLIGYSYKDTIINCHSEGEIRGNFNYTGGLIGHSIRSTITNSYSTSDIIGNDYTGGLIGKNYSSEVKNVYATGNIVSIGNFVGGLIGNNTDGSTVTNSYSTGSVKSSSKRERIGGLVGWNSYASKVIKSYSTGNVSGGTYVGGLVGQNDASDEIIDSYSTGNVEGYSQVGGLVGTNRNYIMHSYSIGAVTGETYLGGLVGTDIGGKVTKSYYDKDESKQSKSAKGESFTTEEMQQKSSYEDWNFDSIWKIEPGKYPTLQWQN